MIYVFLPAFNEEIALPILVKKFSETLSKEKTEYRIVCYDDGSSDNTKRIASELANDFPIDVLSHEKNAGLGQTMIDGIEYLAKITADQDVVVTLDCDDTHEPEFLPEALKKLDEGYDIVLLSRFKGGGGQEGISWWKSFLSMGAGLFLKILFPIQGVREYSCNYRVYRASIIKKALSVFGDSFIRLSHMGFVATPEILIKMRMIKARMVESPFVLKYGQKPTKSANKPIKTILGYLTLAKLYFGKKV